MRRVLTRLAAVSVACVCMTVVLQSPSSAAPTCQIIDPQTGLCSVWVEVPGDPGAPSDPGDDGPKNTGSGSGCFWDGRDHGITKPPPGPVPCQAPSGYWSNALDCYVRLLDPQPPAGDPSWQGHDFGDGAVYSCYQPQTDLLVNFWSQNPPPNSGAAPTPGEVAQIAVERMRLRAIDIGITPEPGPDSIGIVGMPVWLWAQQPDATTYGPITQTASAGGVTVTATARVEAITWSLGDGAEIVCRSAGTPYAASYGAKSSPTCGHTYSRSSWHQPGGKYTVTATSEWVVTWAGPGQNGTIRLNGLQRSVDITVGEAQVLVQ